MRRGIPAIIGNAGEDPIVWGELEAAEALVGLAHSAVAGSGTRSFNGDGRRSHHFNSEFPAGDLGANIEASAPRSSELSEDQAVVSQQQCGNICSPMMKRVNVEQDAELHEPSSVCTTSSTSYAALSGSKSRQKLTEAEKEARRIRRVLANRESARQTIRRRQGEYKELTGKVASLAHKNENLRKGKELAVELYDSLKSTNECLKAQMAKTIDAEVEETQVDSKSINTELPTSPYANCPFFIYNQTPFTPFPWPTIIQSSNHVQLPNNSQNAVVVPSEIPMPSSIANSDPFHEHENTQKTNGPASTLLSVLPSTWFFPLPDLGNRHHLKPSFDLNDKPNGTSMNNQHIPGSSSKNLGHKDNNLHPLLPIEAQTGASSLNFQALSSMVGCSLNAFPDMKRDLTMCPSKKEVVAAAAAEARRKRKELTKLRRLHCRLVPNSASQH
ncbi:hypothetical protein U1Q18_014127 [Sarracenia purpurea var. burkii]